MDISQLNSLIIYHFHISKRRSVKDNLPIGTKFGTRNILGDIFRDAGLNKGVEVGVKKGEFSKVLCEKNPNIELYCVDPWSTKLSTNSNRYYKTAVQTLSPYNAKLLKMNSMDALKNFPDESLDFAYIDANHSFDFCCPDIIFWSQKVRKGGIVGCHDYFAHYKGGVMKAVDAYTHCHHIDPWYVTREVFPTAFWVKAY